MSIISNVITVTLYWSILHKGVLKKLEKYDNFTIWNYWHMVTVHITPGVCCLVNAKITWIIMSQNLLKPVQVFGGIYMVINYIQTHIRGRPVYAFLPWDSYLSYAVAATMIVSFSAVFYLLCKLDFYLKAQLMYNKDEIKDKKYKLL